MQQFTVPQFIDVESKIIGPITTRQFIIILTGFVLGGISYRLFDFSLFITIGLALLVLTGTFGFVKINGRPFHVFLLNFIQTLKKAKLRIWSNAYFQANLPREKFEFKPAESLILTPKRYTTSRLAELSLIVDTGGAYSGEKGESKIEIRKIN